MSERMYKLPRVPLLLGATPLHPLTRIRESLGPECPTLLIKRDDLTPLGLGGNKLRKLEFLAGDARAQNADILITAGAAQSNHCRLTAAVGAMLGFETHLCLRGPAPEKPTGNLILDDWLGATLHFAEPGTDVTAFMDSVVADLRAAGRNPYRIPIGGSNDVGSVGYVFAGLEIAEQAPDATHIVVATGSGGTQAGLEIGTRLAKRGTRVIGIGVAEPDTTSWNLDIATLANQIAARVETSVLLVPEDVECPMDWMGPHYAAPTPECDAAIRLLARTEGIFLDPVYSGKAFAGLLDLINDNCFVPTDTVVFWHTGGTPALFAEGH